MNIVLGVTGGIAAYKAVLLARLFSEAGHEIHVIPTENALRFVGSVTWEAISGNPVVALEEGAGVPHVHLGQQADAIVIAPATANTLAKLVAGLADDMLTATVLASRAPLIVAPAMHTEMWEHPATQQNIATLRERGVAFVGPDSGRLTGADTGPGRMSEPEAIFRAVLDVVGGTGRAESPSDRAKDLTGLHFAISAGGTREPIDPVRYIGNRSSGRQGVALARAAALRGARVDLVAANVDASVLAALAELEGAGGVRLTTVGTAAELQSTMRGAASEADVVIMAAAVADFRPRSVVEGKIKKSELAGEAPTIELVENPDILAGLVSVRRNGQTIVGFAAETDHERLVELGRDKLERKGVDLLAVNAVGWSTGFESDDNAVILLDRAGEVARTAGTKGDVADGILDAVLAQRSLA